MSPRSRQLPSSFVSYVYLTTGNFVVNAPQSGKYFVCKDLTGEINRNCGEFTLRMQRQGWTVLNRTSCMIHRQLNSSFFLFEYVQNLALHPLVWHGNGVGKNLWRKLGDSMVECYLEKLNMTNTEFMKRYLAGM